MIDAQVVEEIRILVRSGFYTKRALIEIVCEEMYEPGTLDPADVSATLDAEIKELETDKEAWPKVTDCDRLDSAFSALNSKGVISLQNAGYTQSDGYSDIRDYYHEHPNKDSIDGYCFYHTQDLERAIRGNGLFLAFGPIDPKLEDTEGHRVGEVIREELQKQGFEVEWDGTFNTRMLLPTISWQKR